MAVCIIAILELSGNLCHYGEEKSVWLHIRAGKEISQLAMISLFQQNYSKPAYYPDKLLSTWLSCFS
jgi:hypothetical protein